MNIQRIGDSNRIEVRLAALTEAQASELETSLHDGECDCLVFSCEGYDGANHLDVFIQALENGPEKVIISGTAALPDIIGRFIQAISRNRKLNNLMLQQLIFTAADLGTLLQVSTSIKCFTVHGCTVAEQPGTWEEGLAEAFDGNETLKTIYVHQSDLTYLAPVVCQLGNHKTIGAIMIVALSLRGHNGQASVATGEVIQSLMSNATTLRIVGCISILFTEESFLPIANGAMDSHVTLFLESCIFDETSTLLFETMFQSKANLRHLAFNCSEAMFSKPTEAMIRTILHPDSQLEMLHLFDICDKAGAIVSTVMKALQKNVSLRNLCFSHLTADEINANDGLVVRALEEGLPRIRGLKMLDFPFHLLSEAQRFRVVQAMQRNCSITVFNDSGVEAFSDDLKAKLRFYFKRNKCLPAMLENPSKVPIALWPKIFEIAQQHEFGATSVFEGLLGLGASICRTTQTRKRIRSDDLEEDCDDLCSKRKRSV